MVTGEMSGIKHRTAGAVHGLLPEHPYDLPSDETVQGLRDIFSFREIQSVSMAGYGWEGYAGNSETITQMLCSNNLSLKNLSESLFLKYPKYFPENSTSGV
jgi:hypothetical protein